MILHVGCNDSFNSENVNPKTIEDDGHIKRKPGSDDVNLLKKRRMDQFDSGAWLNFLFLNQQILTWSCCINFLGLICLQHHPKLI